MMNAIRSTIQNLRNWIADIVEATKEAFAETEAQAKNTSPDLVLLLRDYLNLRKAERSDWSRYGQQKGTTDDLKAVSKAMIPSNIELSAIEVSLVNAIFARRKPQNVYLNISILQDRTVR